MDPRSLLDDSFDLVAFPDRTSERLVARALSEQWEVDRDIAWDQIQLHALPRSVRDAMRTVYSHIHFGEVLALRLAERALHGSGEGWVRRFCGVQVIDEARHVRFFSRVLGQLEEPVAVGNEMVELADMLDACRTPEEVALGVQVILEGFAQTMFLEGARRGRMAAADAIRLPRAASTAAFLTALVDYVGKDESRHVAFGIHYLRGHLQNRDRASRDRLEFQAERWVAQMQRVAGGLARATAALGIPSDALRTKVADTQRRHLQQIGLGPAV